MLGLRPPLSKEASRQFAIGNNLAYMFHRHKMISENVMGFYMTPRRTQLKLKTGKQETTKSQIRFGKLNSDLIDNKNLTEAIVWFQSVDPFGWAIHITDAWVGKRQIWFTEQHDVVTKHSYRRA